MIVRLRLRKEFKHASFRRAYSDNLVVRCELADGTVGWGEGIPRSYVTGETPEGSIEQLAATDLAGQLGVHCEGWSDVIAMCRNYRPSIGVDDPRGCLANAHRCAVELSLLDAFGKCFESPISDLVGAMTDSQIIASPSSRVQYSSAISSGGVRKQILSSLAMRLYGFRHCKIKVGMNPEIDPERLRRMRYWVGSKMDLRVDANEAWRGDEVVSRIVELEPFGISCVEQPVRHDDVKVLRRVRDEVATPIMLDESLTSLEDARQAIADQTCDVFNIRLSKCGGFLNSLRLAGMAYEAGLEFQLGCHPGESGILSAAGRHFATSVGPIRYIEGSADAHLLRDFITRPTLTFGRGGWAPAIRLPGLGITVDEAKLKPLSRHIQKFRIASQH
ncbi:L-Ala-D/L-Glu epimerase [Neorhodopirellula pilleata]|uniref:Dipeptide epimerase n=2 Tax=Neorhodopirellula pilleata TaxID=2714738 RepID=A0A5C6A2R3_9BACT|nr:L-Ala-D/L-Glu epimerase [Neorhodopirellula pilleata]